MARLRSIVFAIVFYAGTVLAVLGILPVAALGGAPLRRYVRGWARFHRWCARALLGVVARVEGAVPEGPVLIASKHQAMFETIEFVLILGAPATVVKRELAAIPLWGWAARRWGVIPVDRAGSAAALRAMTAAARMAVAEGRAVLIFPEGTRVAPGETPPLKPGFAGLYRALGLPVVPVALDSGRVWPRRLVKRAGVVTMRFGAPIPPGLSRKEVEARVWAAINGLEG